MLNIVYCILVPRIDAKYMKSKQQKEKIQTNFAARSRGRCDLNNRRLDLAVAVLMKLLRVGVYMCTGILTKLLMLDVLL